MGRSQHHKGKKSSGFFASLFRGLFSGDAPLRTDSSARERKGASHRRLRFEGCEDRRMLSVGVNYNETTDTLTLTGSADPDAVTVVGRATYLDIFVSGNFQARLQNANSSNVAKISFDGAGGNDSLAVQNITALSGANNIDLTNVESLSVIGSGSADVQVRSNGSLSLASSKIPGTLSVNITGAGNLTQTGAVTVSGLASLALADGDITLTNAANNFATVDIDANAVAGQDASITDVNGVVFAASEVTGNLTVRANQNSTSRTAISQTGALDVDGTTTLTAGSASTMKLDNAGNALTGAVSITRARNATLYNTLATTLGESSVTRDLSVTAEAAITQSGPLTVGNVATFKARTSAPLDQNITLTNADNNFRTLGVTNGANVAIVDLNALTLNTSTISGTLGVTTDGAITQRGALSVTGATTLEAGADNNITLSRSTNDFASSVSIVSGQNVYLRDRTGGLDLGASTIEGTFYAISGGAITDSGILSVVNGKTTLKAPSSQAITLDQAGNDFLEVAIASGKDVTLLDGNDLILATSRISGTLGVTTAGELTQSGGLAVKSNTTTLTAGGDVTLDNARNDFKTVAATGGGNVALRDLNAVILRSFTVAGDLSVQANLNASRRVAVTQGAGTTLTVGGSTILEGGSGSTITLDKTNTLHGLAGDVSVTAGAMATLRNNGPLVLGESNLSGNLTAISNTGSITQTGGVVVGKIGTFTASTDISLDDGANNFGTVIVSAGAAHAVTIVDVDALILGASTLGGTTTLSVTTDGAITQSGILSIAGATTLSAGEVNDIVLSNPSNEFSSVGIESAQNVTLRDTDAIDLALSTISGTLGVTAAGITDSGALDIAGKATFIARDSFGDLWDVDLDSATNNLGEVAVPYADNVMLVNDNALILAASKIATDLTVTTTGGGLTQSGALTVGGLTTLDTGTDDIELTNAANNFATLGVIAAENVSLRDINAIELDGATLNADLTVTAGGNITQTAGGSLAVFGNTTLATSVIADITLTEDNSFGLLADNFVAVTSANNVSLTADQDTQLGASTISGSLTVAINNAGPVILSQLGALAVGDTLTLNVGATNDVDLTDVGNTFDTVSVTSGLNVSLRTAGSLDLAASTVSGNLTAISDGSITDSGTVSVGGDTDLTAAVDITLDSAASTYGTGGAASALQLSGANVAVTNNRNTALGDVFATGDLTITVTGAGNDLTNRVDDAMPFNGLLSVAGTASLTATDAVTLYTAGWSYGSLFTQGASVTNVPATAPVLAGIEAGALAYTASNPAVQITNTITASDADTPTLSSATIRITGNFNAADVLSFTPTATITGSQVGDTLTLTGTDTLAAYVAVLKTVKFATTAVGTSPRTVTFTVNDGSLNSNAVTRDITVS